jgi:hypothetical protein
MKSMNKPENDDHLSNILQEWTVSDALPARFQEQVWKRICLAEGAGKPALWPTLVRLVEVMLVRPKFALSYVAALLVLGLVAGAVAAQVKTSHLDATLSVRYVQSIDPYWVGSSQP